MRQILEEFDKFRYFIVFYKLNRGIYSKKIFDSKNHLDRLRKDG